MRTMNRGTSTFSWLDTDDAQTRRVREAIALLDDKDASDPLGTGRVRDTFAGALSSPGFDGESPSNPGRDSTPPERKGDTGRVVRMSMQRGELIH